MMVVYFYAQDATRCEPRFGVVAQEGFHAGPPVPPRQRHLEHQLRLVDHSATLIQETNRLTLQSVAQQVTGRSHGLQPDRTPGR